jgi:N-acetylglucosaminyl-diphospho-decaprenol L-rhamnosyltransferase
MGSGVRIAELNCVRADVAISIVSTNNRDLLARCLQSIPLACRGLDWDVTVVDNASTDGTGEMLATGFPWVAVLQNEVRGGFSANHNQVIRPLLVEHEYPRYVLILNEDTEFDPGAVAELVFYCDQHPHVGAVGPVIRGPDGREQRSYFQYPAILRDLWWTLRPESAGLSSRSKGWLNGSCVLVRTEALRATGPLDERFFIFFEDADLGRRLLLAGWESTQCRSAGMLHHGHETVSQPKLGSIMERQMIRSRYLYFTKHRGRAYAHWANFLFRLVFIARASKALATAIIARSSGERRQARMLLELSRYSPRDPLPHEGPRGGASA